MYLRNLYGEYKDYISGSKRSQADKAAVISADSLALTKGVKLMNKLDYGTKASDDELDDTLFGNNLKAFVDTYNNTINSASSSDLKDIKKLVSKLKGIGEDYQKELSKLGISIDDDGYMTIASTAVETLDNSKFEKIFGKDSEFTSTIRSLAKKIYRHIDTSV